MFHPPWVVFPGTPLLPDGAVCTLWQLRAELHMATDRPSDTPISALPAGHVPVVQTMLSSQWFCLASRQLVIMSRGSRLACGLWHLEQVNWW